MRAKVVKQVLVWSGTLTLTGALLLVSRFVEVSSWVWAACLAGAGLGAGGLYLADRSDGLVLLEGYVLWAIAGLIAAVPSGLLQGGAIACYVLLAIALPFLGIFYRDRARWWALLLAYPLLVISGAVGLAGSGLVGDDLITAYVFLAMAIPFFVIHARLRRQWWALIPGGVLAVLGLSFGSWLPWHSAREFLIAGTVIKVAAVLVLAVAGIWVLVRVFASREPASESAGPGSDGPSPRGPEMDDPQAV